MNTLKNHLKTRNTNEIKITSSLSGSLSITLELIPKRKRKLPNEISY